MTTYQQRSPWLHSLTLTTLNTNYNLLTLAQAITPTLPSFCRSVAVQIDIGAGSAKVFIGSPDSLSATDCGWSGVATQVWNSTFYIAGGLELSDVDLRTDTSGTQVNITIVMG